MNWIDAGGIFLWPIVFCSLASLALVLNRSWFFWRVRQRQPYGAFIKRLQKELELCPLKRPDWIPLSRSPVAQITSIYFDYIVEPAPIREEAIKREGNRLLLDMERGLKPLSSIAQVCPLLGLLGTVCGLVVAFHSIEQAGGQVQVGDMAGGIWGALLTTVCGLIVGIPTLLSYQYFQAKVDRTAARMNFVLSELDEMLMRHSNRNRDSVSDLPDFRQPVSSNPSKAFHVG